MRPWVNPWTWREFRTVRLQLRIASGVMAAAILGFIPAAWIVLMPADPTLRPDLTTTPAWIGLAVAAVLAISGNSIARRARARFDHAVYEITRHTRDMAAARGLPLEIDVGETFPPLLVSRQHRMIGVAAPTPVLISMDQLEKMEAVDGAGTDPDAPRQPHLVLHLTTPEPKRVHVVPGRGLARASLDQVRILGERMREFLDPRGEWDQKTTKTVDVAAFVDSMRPR